MADYKELLHRAVEALPENNGAARRAVYEKARAALVGQLRAINPPLAARDITTHRLQLEDCIRQVEQQASEAAIAGIGQEPASPPPRAVPEPAKDAKAESKPEPRPELRPEQRPAGRGSIEDIIAAAENDTRPARPAEPHGHDHRPPKSQPVLVARNAPKPHASDDGAAASARSGTDRPLPSIVARAEAAKGRPVTGNAFGVPADKPYDAGRRGPAIEPRRDRGVGAAAARQVTPFALDDADDVAAMSVVREVEVEPQPADPQGAIDRAIATLDREARGDEDGDDTAPDIEMDDEPMAAPSPRRGATNGAFVTAERADDRPSFKPAREPRTAKSARDFAQPVRGGRAAEAGFPRARTEDERGGMGAVTIFLIVFVVLMLGAGGAGFWAWQEGYINLEAMFGKGQPVVEQSAAATPPPTPGSGNTATPAEANTAATGLKVGDRLPTTAASNVAAVDPSAPLALQSPTADAKTEARLGSDAAKPGTAEAAVASVDPATIAGSQSLLLEASDNGTTGAVPFTGTVDWTKGTDETGQPTIVGKANIPARNLSVDLLIRKNSDASLPASHLMEINFTVSDTFIGGSVAGLPGVLLKNEELVQGAPLVGASARVVGNSFLFALSAAPEDSTANVNLLTSRKWMDLALIYATGKRAIITLEKDDKADKLFADVFGAWSKTASN